MGTFELCELCLRLSPSKALIWRIWQKFSSTRNCARGQIHSGEVDRWTGNRARVSHRRFSTLDFCDHAFSCSTCAVSDPRCSNPVRVPDRWAERSPEIRSAQDRHVHGRYCCKWSLASAPGHARSRGDKTTSRQLARRADRSSRILDRMGGKTADDACKSRDFRIGALVRAETLAHYPKSKCRRHCRCHGVARQSGERHVCLSLPP